MGVFAREQAERAARGIQERIIAAGAWQILAAPDGASQ